MTPLKQNVKTTSIKGYTALYTKSSETKMGSVEIFYDDNYLVSSFFIQDELFLISDTYRRSLQDMLQAFGFKIDKFFKTKRNK